MSEFRHTVAEFIRASNKLLEAKDAAVRAVIAK